MKYFFGVYKMCGFSGIYRLPGTRVLSEHGAMLQALKQMNSKLQKRGPDAQGFCVRGRIGLSHSRLSVIDPSDKAAQPMASIDGLVVLSYNGEIYNFQGLRKTLQAEGVTFRTSSDTEVILEAYRTWGRAGLDQLEGMFAFALWDERDGTLLLMRDRLGVKPLYYGVAQGCLVFGSEIEALRASGLFGNDLDPQALSEYLWFGNSHGTRTLHAEINSVAPGHMLSIGSQDLAHVTKAWWRLEDWLDRGPLECSYEEGIEMLQAALRAAVTRQLVSDVPLGLFLSGGIDSSAIAVAAARTSVGPIDSYSASFDFADGSSEAVKARAVADHLGLRHHDQTISGAGLESTLRLLAMAHGEPFGDAANIPLYMMCAAFDGHIKVVLQGDGGDELFAGYRRHALLEKLDRWRMVPRILAPMIARMGHRGPRLARLIEALCADSPGERMARLLTMENQRLAPERFLEHNRRMALAAETDPFAPYRAAGERFAYLDNDPVTQMLMTDLTVQLPSQFLPKVDRATMAAGIEARVPLLDERIAELAVRMPAHWKVKGGQKKRILRDALRRDIPDHILDAPKTGFSVPYSNWLRGPLYDLACQQLLDPATAQALGLDRAGLETALRAHRDGAFGLGFTLWKYFQLALWWSTR